MLENVMSLFGRKKEETQQKNLNNNESEPVIGVNKKNYSIGDMFNIQRSSGKAEGVKVVNNNDTKFKFSDETGEPLVKLDFINSNETVLWPASKIDMYKIDKPEQLQQPEIRVNYEKPERVGNGDIITGQEAHDLANSVIEYRTSSGCTIAAATDKGIGYKEKNEDRVMVDPKNEIVVVVDGMGGMGDGNIAAHVLARKIAENPREINVACEDTSEEIYQNPNIDNNAGACFAGIDLKTGDVFHSGDCRVVVFDGNGNIKFCTTDQTTVQSMVDGERGYEKITKDEALYHPKRNVVKGGIRANNSGFISNKIQLASGDRVVLMSDGISDNLTDEEIGGIIRGQEAKKAIEKVSTITNLRMVQLEQIKAETDAGYSNDNEGRVAKGRYSDGYLSEPKKDNRAFSVVDIP